MRKLLFFIVFSSVCFASKEDKKKNNNRVKCKGDLGIILLLPKYEFTRSQLETGVQLNYRIKVKKDLSAIYPKPLDMGGASGPGQSGLYAFASVSGKDQYFGLRDLGMGAGAKSSPSVIKSGKYEETLSWDGKNWNGPSDYMAPKGKPFPSGEYTFKVEMKGQWELETTKQDYHVKCEAPLNIVE